MARVSARHALAELRRYYQRNGYVRTWPDREKSPSTHRGYELRFTALDLQEVHAIVGLLRTVGIEPGKPFLKKTHYRIPVYGSDQVAFLAEALCWE